MASTTTTTQTILPQEVSDATKEILGEAKTLSKTPYPLYTGPRIAGFNPDQYSAFDMTKQAAGSWKPYADTAGKKWTDAGVADSYMNPYTSNVMKGTLDELMRTAGIQRKGIGRAATASNAFGDDRHAILEGEFDRNLSDVTGKTANQILAQAYESGAGRFGADRDAAMKMAQLVPQLGLQDAGALWGIGSQQQGQEQAGLDLALEDFWRQVGWPMELLNWRSGLTSQTPYGTTQITSMPKAKSGGDLAGLLGGAAALFGGLGSLGGSGGIGDWFS